MADRNHRRAGSEERMDWFTFSSNVIGDVTWPLLIAGVLLAFRKQIFGVVDK